MKMFQLNKEDEFKEVKRYAGPSLINLSDNEEIYLVRMSADLMNPSNLINKEIVIGKKLQALETNEMVIDVKSRGVGLSEFTLLVPDGQTGELRQVNKKIVGQISLSGMDIEQGEKNLQTYNLESFKSVQHEPPDLKERDFYQNERSNFKSRNLSPSKEHRLQKKSKNKKSKNDSSIINIHETSDTSYRDENLCKQSLFMENNNDESAQVIKKKKLKKNKDISIDAEEFVPDSYLSHEKDSIEYKDPECKSPIEFGKKKRKRNFENEENNYNFPIPSEPKKKRRKKASESNFLDEDL